MKIGLFTDGYTPLINGVTTTVRDLKHSLRDIGHDVHVVAPTFPQHTDNDPQVLRLKSFRLYKNPELRLSYMWPDKIFQKVLMLDFDIYHGFSGGSIPSLGLALAKFRKKPYVFTYNTRLNQYTHYFLGGKVIRPKAVEKIVELFCNVCDVVVAPADYVKEELIEFGVKKPIEVIPNGVNIEKFKPGESNFLQRELNLPEGAKIILYIGRLAKEKDVSFLIKTFTKSKLTNTYFAIVGDGPERKNLEKLVTKLGMQDKIKFFGFIEHADLGKVYNSADVFVFASTTETQGMIILEAMSSGLPVLTVKDKVFSQFIENGKDGFIVAKNEEEYISKLNEILSNKELRGEVGKSAREKIVKDFSLEKIAKRFEALYNKLV